MPEEVNINLGDKNSGKHKSRSCFEGACPPNPMDLIDGILEQAPMLLGIMLTYMKMDQFNRPLANTAEKMLEGLVPQIEKNATKIGGIFNALAEASHNVSAKMTKHDYDFTTADKIHLIKLLIEEDNYFDSYDAVIDFIKYQRPGFIKALYKNLVANNNKAEGAPSVHAESATGKANLASGAIHEVRPSAHPDRFNHISEKILDRHMAKAKQALGVAKIGLEGDGLIKNKTAADLIGKHVDLDDTSQDVVDKSKDKIIGSTLKDSEIAADSLNETIDGDEKKADDTLNKNLITADKIKDKIKEATPTGHSKTPEQINTDVESSLNSDSDIEKQNTAAKERGKEDDVQSEIERRKINEEGKKEIEKAKNYKSSFFSDTPEKKETRVEKAKETIKKNQEVRKKEQDARKKQQEARKKEAKNE
tara:strand:- start:2339 stop:3598 length:1260 start_codon:yes stop_codon:yes gene_type:complete